MMKKIAFVVQRYGLEVCGGAEYHCRVLAEHMTPFYQVEVLTSCARSYSPWKNDYEAGAEELNGVCVRRFHIDKICNAARLAVLDKEMRKGNREAEEEWLDEVGPCCPSLITFLEQYGERYAAVIFVTYAYYMTVKGIGLHLKNSILLPTAHDEPGIYMPIYRDVFQMPAAILYNSVEEKKFIMELFHTEGKASRLTCVGIDIPEEQDEAFPERLMRYRDDYIVYVGRVSNGKNFAELNRDFIEYKKRNPSPLRLIVVGKLDEGMELIHSEDIIYAGFVSEEEKTTILRNAKLLVMPSLYESLSLVILESMAVGRPVLVNGECAVLRGQCIRSNAGLYYTNYFEFEACLDYMLSDKEAYEQMRENGRRFVEENYSWDKVAGDVRNLVEEISK